MAKRTELCPVETTARIVAGRWKAAVLEHSSEALSDFPK
jgi:DNA-binding HxlR family transcriptional regulator